MLGVAAFATVLSPLSVLAADAALSFQDDPVERWTARGLAWVLAAASVLVVWSLFSVVVNGRGGGRNKLVMIVAVVILPSFSVATGMLLVFMRAERVEFCASCHLVMQPYAEDLTDPAGTGLAAVHFANRYIPHNQCYECHTSYGLFGTVEAKLHGIAEVFRYYTGRYDLPVEMWRPYSNRDCLKCHEGARRWLALDAHTDGDIQERLAADALSCMDCHEPAHTVSNRIARVRR
ncbi:MAG TPA: NapC/NirT family cytochrome c [Candidatus Sulfomarinibacteraceae bacterium]|nr:NapC/NirT family cytochrome c [Candidatus Sulfomarinibacteraceae bacterium]